MSIVVTFASPLPLRPRTSIGLLTGASLLLLFVLVVLWRQKKLSTPPTQVSDWFVMGFALANACSLLGAPHVYELTSFRLLLSAVMQYAAVRFLQISKKEQKIIILTLGMTTVSIALMSLFQVAFRDQAILLAKKFLFGDAAFSLSWDLARGRAPHWGTIVVSFPFFIMSAILFGKEKNRLLQAYIQAGIFLIPFSFIVSNFRWLTLCFFIGLGLFAYPLMKKRLVSFVWIKKILFMSSAAILFGSLLASLVFQYNLIDRFLLKERQRDVVFTLGRTFLYQQAISAFFSSPVIGIGTGNYRYVIERPTIVHFYDIREEDGENNVDGTQRETVSSHNDALTLLAETGLLGALMFIGLNVAVLSRLFFVFRQSFKTNDISTIVYPLGYIVSLIMYYAIGIFENTTPNIIIYVFFLYASSITWFSQQLPRK